VITPSGKEVYQLIPINNDQGVLWEEGWWEPRGIFIGGIYWTDFKSLRSQKLPHSSHMHSPSPNGNQIAYESRPHVQDHAGRWYSESHLMILDLETMESREIPLSDLGFLSQIIDLFWFGDGEHLMVGRNICRETGVGEWACDARKDVIIDLDGNEIRELSEIYGGDWYSSSDGKLAYKIGSQEDGDRWRNWFGCFNPFSDSDIYCPNIPYSEAPLSGPVLWGSIPLQVDDKENPQQNSNNNQVCSQMQVSASNADCIEADESFLAFYVDFQGFEPHETYTIEMDYPCRQEILVSDYSGNKFESEGDGSNRWSFRFDSLRNCGSGWYRHTLSGNDSGNVAWIKFYFDPINNTTPNLIDPTVNASSTAQDSTTVDHWRRIDRFFSDEELMMKYKEDYRFGELIPSWRIEPYATIMGWTGIVNGVGNVKFSIGESEWNSVVLIIAFFNSDRNGNYYLSNLPITVCVGKSSSPSCFYNYINFNPTNNFPGTPINTDELDSITSIFRDHIGTKIRNYIILPGRSSDSSSIMDGIQTEIWNDPLNEFIQDACSESCYMFDYSFPADYLYQPEDIVEILEKHDQPWGLFVQGSQLYTENEGKENYRNLKQ
jgi:hypothetical protein